MRRVLERRRDSQTVRVEVLGAEGITVEELPDTEAKTFFTNVELKSTTQSAPGLNGRLVTFELSSGANYAI